MENKKNFCNLYSLIKFTVQIILMLQILVQENSIIIAA